MNSETGGPLQPPSTPDLINEQMAILTAALPKIDKLIKDYKKTRAAIMTSKSPAGMLHYSIPVFLLQEYS